MAPLLALLAAGTAGFAAAGSVTDIRVQEVAPDNSPGRKRSANPSGTSQVPVGQLG